MGNKENVEGDDYLKHRAARLGDKAQHPGAVITSGSTDVLINDRPAVRVDVDLVTCPADGPEYVKMGADQVLINGHEAVRQYDVAEGAGPADVIVEGSPDVSIGQTGESGGVGLDTAAAAKAFCADLCAMTKDWPNLSLDQRKERAQKVFNDLQARNGLPPTAVTWGEGDPQFGQDQWSLRLPDSLLKKDKITTQEIGGNAYHESRHAEQSFYALRYRATWLGLDSSEESARRLFLQTGVPMNVCRAAVASPRLAPETREYKFGRLMDNLNNGAGRSATGWAEWYAQEKPFNRWFPTLFRDGTQYHQLPNEKDARLVGYAGECDGCC